MNDSARPVIVWFRNDLRTGDNPALAAAVATGKPIVALYVLEDSSDGLRPLGSASKYWLHKSLLALNTSLRALGSELIFKSGNTRQAINETVSETGADQIVWNRRYDGPEIALDTAIKADLVKSGIDVGSFNGNLLAEPWERQTKSGTPFRVFTPFWKSIASGPVPRMPLPAPEFITSFPDHVGSRTLESLDLLPTPNWADGFSEIASPGENNARVALSLFLEAGHADYGAARDIPSLFATSRLSAHLRFGEISPFQIWHAVKMAEGAETISSSSAQKFLSEIAWREFSYHLLFHNPKLATENYNQAFDNFPWQFDQDAFDAWTTGRTGYPIVDAGMRQLWRTGWMHNRVRMITASFLIKHLQIDWRHGEKWFWDTLTDADCANNPAGWQWVAGSGADASPYFRIFNPILQGEKFDPDGHYVRQWVPELASMENKWLHKPWQAPTEVLEQARIVLGKSYPLPLVDHAEARQSALAAFKSIRSRPPEPESGPEGRKIRIGTKRRQPVPHHH